VRYRGWTQYLSKGDPPVYAFYNEPRDLPKDPKPGDGIHHINFGLKLKERMDKLSIECVVRHQDEGANPLKETVEFLAKHLRAKQ
jgi:acetyl esterase